jgi:hypothetical protein
MRRIRDIGEIRTSLPNKITELLMNRKGTKNTRRTYSVTNREMTYNFPRTVCSMTAQYETKGAWCV